MKSTQKMSEVNISNFYFLCIYVQKSIPKISKNGNYI